MYFYFCFSLYNSSGEARPHLPPLTARPWLYLKNSLQICQNFLKEKQAKKFPIWMPSEAAGDLKNSSG